MDDLIRRSDAIDGLYKMLHDCFFADDEELDAVITTLNELPSAQQEHATCYLDSPCEYQNENITLPSAQPEILKDGTLVIDLTLEQLDKVNRVLLKSERWCKLMYMDAERKNEGRE